MSHPSQGTVQGRVQHAQRAASVSKISQLYVGKRRPGRYVCSGSGYHSISAACGAEHCCFCALRKSSQYSSLSENINVSEKRAGHAPVNGQGAGSLSVVLPARLVPLCPVLPRYIGARAKIRATFLNPVPCTRWPSACPAIC